jgi:hypothetical protein
MLSSCTQSGIDLRWTSQGGIQQLARGFGKIDKAIKAESASQEWIARTKPIPAPGDWRQQE